MAAVRAEIKIEGVGDNNAEVLSEVASATGVDPNRVQTCGAMGGQHSPEDMSNQNSPYMSAAGKTSTDEKIAEPEAEPEGIRNEKAQAELKSTTLKRLRRTSIIARCKMSITDNGEYQGHIRVGKRNRRQWHLGGMPNCTMTQETTLRMCDTCANRE